MSLAALRRAMVAEGFDAGAAAWVWENLARDQRNAHEIPRSDVQRGVKLYRRFMGFEPTRLDAKKIPELGPVFVRLGTCSQVNYLAKKNESRPVTTEYVHKFTRPPEILSNTGGNAILIVGGGFKITSRGIVG